MDRRRVEWLLGLAADRAKAAGCEHPSRRQCYYLAGLIVRCKEWNIYTTLAMDTSYVLTANMADAFTEQLRCQIENEKEG